MRKIVTTLLLIFCTAAVFAQTDFEKQFEELTRNTTGIPYGQNKEVGKYYAIRGFKMYAETYGQGAPLLIIHGNGGSISNFVNQIPFFSKQYKVILADSRAQGNSKDEADSLSYEMMADDYAALLDAMKIDSAYVIGWSDGGINGLLLSIRHPEKVKKLAVTGANLWPDSTSVFNEVWDLVMPDYNSLKSKTDKTAQEKSAWKLMRLLVEQPHIPLTDLNKISIPVLVMSGDHDVIRPAHSLLISENIPRSYLWILPNSGHSTPIMYRDEFNKKVDEFFRTPFRTIDKEKRFF